ncbi:MAG: hypothetical protein ABR598_05650 [Candidatus Dormibacteria bacterium]
MTVPEGNSAATTQPLSDEGLGLRLLQAIPPRKRGMMDATLNLVLQSLLVGFPVAAAFGLCACGPASAAVPGSPMLTDDRAVSANFCYRDADATGPVFLTTARITYNNQSQSMTVRVSPFRGSGRYSAGPTNGSDPARPAFVQLFRDTGGQARDSSVVTVAEGALSKTPIWTSISGVVTIGDDNSGSLDVGMVDMNRASPTYGGNKLKAKLRWTFPHP